MVTSTQPAHGQDHVDGASEGQMSNGRETSSRPSPARSDHGGADGDDGPAQTSYTDPDINLDLADSPPLSVYRPGPDDDAEWVA